MKTRRKFIVLIACCVFMFVAGFFLQACSDAEKTSPAANKAVKARP